MLPLSPSRRQRAHTPEAKRNTLHRRHRATHNDLRSTREQCVDALKRLIAARGSNRFFNKAMVLLTRIWAETPWNGRAQLLQTADWLIRIGASDPQAVEPCFVPVGAKATARNA
jgi:hypothetical protein